MKHADLPPLPIGSVYGPSACATVQLYLAVLEDVSPEQAQLVFEHIKSCAQCRAELRLLRQVARCSGGWRLAWSGGFSSGCC